MHRRPYGRAGAVLAAAVAVSLLLAGCSGGGSQDAATGMVPTPSGPPPTPVHLSATAVSKLSRVTITATDIGADAAPTNAEDISLEMAAALLPDDPTSMVDLQSWGFLGGHSEAFSSQGSGVTAGVQAFATVDGAHAAFGAFLRSASGVPSWLKSTNGVTVTDLQHAFLSVPTIGDEAYGIETSYTVTASQLRGKSANFSVRAVVFRKGDLILSVMSTPALSADRLISAAQKIAAKA